MQPGRFDYRAGMHLLTRAGALLFTLVAAAVAQVRDASDTTRWRPLFNGKDLAGWTPKIKGYPLGDNHADTFRVEDGRLEVRYDGYEEFGGRFGHLFHDTPFANYRLRAEYRFVGEQCRGGPEWAFRNSGVMVHGQSAASMTREQEFPVSIEVQLLGGRSEGERATANLCTPGTHVVLAGELCKRHCTDSSSKTYRGDQWVTVEIEVRDNRIKHIVDGVTVLEYTDPQLDDSDADARRLLAAGQPLMLRGGTISLQSESHPIDFRKVEIIELDSAPTADGGWTDLLANNDLAKHWRTEGNWQIGDDGVVTLTPRPGESGWSRFGSYLWLNERYEDFEIEFDYRVSKHGNSGFYLHVGDEASPVEHGIEVQILDAHDGDGPLTDHDCGGIIPGIPPAASSARAAGEWNHFQITCKGRALTVQLNDKIVNTVDLDRPELAKRPARGSIGFQDHGLPLALRRIRIRAPR